MGMSHPPRVLRVSDVSTIEYQKESLDSLAQPARLRSESLHDGRAVVAEEYDNRDGEGEGD
jgi:hypothetical protein